MNRCEKLMKSRPSHNNVTNMEYLKNENNQFVCPSCGIIKDRQNTMHYHMKKCLGNTHKCKLCTAEFIQQHSLDIHMHTDHPQHATIIVETHKCPFTGCPYSSLNKGNTRVHYIRNHCKDYISMIKAKDNTCLACNVEFSSAPAFMYHAPYCMPFIANDERITDLTKLCD